jgi:hypothetical protein
MRISEWNAQHVWWNSRCNLGQYILQFMSRAITTPCLVFRQSIGHVGTYVLRVWFSNGNGMSQTAVGGENNV